MLLTVGGVLRRLPTFRECPLGDAYSAGFGTGLSISKPSVVAVLTCSSAKGGELA